MLVDIDSKNNNEYIIEELDEEHILVKETKINELKARLNNVGCVCYGSHCYLTDGSQMIKDRLKEPEESDSE